MKKITIILLFFGCTLSAQVGIGTTEPSGAAMLEISSTSNDVDYKGFMPPRVTLAQRDLIKPKAKDIGLMVFVNDVDNAKQCVQIWNSIAWQDLYCIENIAFANVVQNFDGGNTWTYSTDVPFFESSNGLYGITDVNTFDDITSLTNNFLGINDLNNNENGTSDFATITFASVDISALPNGAVVSFNYDFFEFDNGDASFYTLIIDGNDQTEVQLISGGVGGISLKGTISEIVPAGTLNVALRVRIKQNGADDYAGFDNFVISAN